MHDLSCENPILGAATLGATLGIRWMPGKCQPKFSERFLQSWGGPREPLDMDSGFSVSGVLISGRNSSVRERESKEDWLTARNAQHGLD